MEADDVIQFLLNELIVDLGEGNPGGLSVLKMILNEFPEDSFEIIEKLVKHQIKGSNIWVLFKEKGQDIHSFISYIKSLN